MTCAIVTEGEVVHDFLRLEICHACSPQFQFFPQYLEKFNLLCSVSVFTPSSPITCFDSSTKTQEGPRIKISHTALDFSVEWVDPSSPPLNEEIWKIWVIKYNLVLAKYKPLNLNTKSICLYTMFFPSQPASEQQNSSQNHSKAFVQAGRHVWWN